MARLLGGRPTPVRRDGVGERQRPPQDRASLDAAARPARPPLHCGGAPGCSGTGHLPGGRCWGSGLGGASRQLERGPQPVWSRDGAGGAPEALLEPAGMSSEVGTGRGGALSRAGARRDGAARRAAQGLAWSSFALACRRDHLRGVPDHLGSRRPKPRGPGTEQQPSEWPGPWLPLPQLPAAGQRCAHPSPRPAAAGAACAKRGPAIEPPWAPPRLPQPVAERRSVYRRSSSGGSARHAGGPARERRRRRRQVALPSFPPTSAPHPPSSRRGSSRPP